MGTRCLLATIAAAVAVLPRGRGGPCDLYAAGGTPCVAAHSMTRALFDSYDGPLYTVLRRRDNATVVVGVLSPGGVADAAAHDRHCGEEDAGACTVSRIFDQSIKRNHLTNFATDGDYGVNASEAPVGLVGRKKAYGAYFDARDRHPSWAPIHKGYINDNASGLAVRDEPESMYMVVSGTHFNDQCCFDYGNAETDALDDGAGTMEAIYFGNDTDYWNLHKGFNQTKSWHGPYVMADIEAGMYGGNDTFNPRNRPLNHNFTTAMLRGRVRDFSLKGGDAQRGPLTVLYDGARPAHKDMHNNS
jgi:hypothetical protein